jgi:hypothetical protein
MRPQQLQRQRHHRARRQASHQQPDAERRRPEIQRRRHQRRSRQAVLAPARSSNDEKQTATFHFAEALKPGSYQLKLDYTGKIGTQAGRPVLARL